MSNPVHPGHHLADVTQPIKHEQHRAISVINTSKQASKQASKMHSDIHANHCETGIPTIFVKTLFAILVLYILMQTQNGSGLQRQ